MIIFILTFFCFSSKDRIRNERTYLSGNIVRTWKKKRKSSWEEKKDNMKNNNWVNKNKQTKSIISKRGDQDTTTIYTSIEKSCAYWF